jgi:uncharacterized membrane protein YiaA
MSDSAVVEGARVPARTGRGWLIAAAVGCALVVIPMAVVALVIADKPHFGGLVGTWFVQVISSGVIAGALLVLVGAWNLPQRRSWRGIVLLAWGLVALTSPLFGFLFLLPWGIMVLTLPLVVAIFIALFRGN